MDEHLQQPPSSNDSDRIIDYCEAFMAITPRIAAGTLLARLRKLKSLDDEMIDYFKDRAQIEEAHAKLLNRLAKKLTASAEKERSKEKTLLGRLASVWDQVQSNAGESSKCHTLLAERLTGDLEQAISKSKENRESTAWSGLKGYESTLNKLAREHDEHMVKIDKLTKQFNAAKESDSSSKTTGKAEKRLKEALDKQEKFKEHYRQESKSIFQTFKTLDRNQMEFVQGVWRKSVEFQINNLKLQLMNLEQALTVINQIDLDMELYDFTTNHAKEKSTSESDQDLNSDSNSDKKSIASTSKQTPADSNGADSTLGPSPAAGFKVDEDGYRVPQLDHSKWLSEFAAPQISVDAPTEEGEVVGAITITAPPKIKFDIKTPVSALSATSSAADDLADIERAAAQFKSLLSVAPNQGAATIRRRQRGTLTQQQSPANNNAANVDTFSVSSLMPSATSQQSTAVGTPSSIHSANHNTHSLPAALPPPVLVQEAEVKLNEKLAIHLPINELIESLGIRFKIQEFLSAQISPDGTIKQFTIQGSVLASISEPATNSKEISGLPELRIAVPFSNEFDYFEPRINGSSVSQQAASTGPFKVDIGTLKQRQSTGQNAIFTYRFTTSDDEILKRCLPICISAKMRASPTLSQLAISFNYNRESNYVTSSPSSGRLPIDDLSVLLGIEDMDDSTMPVTKPQAVLNVEKKKLLWKLGSINDSNGMLQKLLAQWQVRPRNSSTPVNATFALKYQCHGSAIISGLRMEIAQTGQSNLPVRSDWIECTTAGQLNIEAAVIKFSVLMTSPTGTVIPTVNAQPLTSADFEPFGQVIQFENNAPTIQANQGTARRRNYLAQLWNGRPETALPNLCIFRVQPAAKLPFPVRLLERHPYSTQAFIPMATQPPNAYKPDLSQLKAFVAGPHQERVDFSCLVWEAQEAADCEEVFFCDKDAPPALHVYIPDNLMCQ